MLQPGPEGFIDRIPDPGGLPDWISKGEFDHYVDEFSRNGFTAPLNWYRCFDRNWELTATTRAATISVPSPRGYRRSKANAQLPFPATCAAMRISPRWSPP